MTTIVRAAEPAQLLSAVPHMFGFTPTRSAVVIPFARSRSAGAIRVDLPREESVDTVAATVIGLVCRVRDADAYALIVYDEARPDATVPHAALAAALRVRAQACGVRTVDALYVGGGSWASYLDAAICGEAAALANAHPDTGPPPEGDQTSGAVLPDTDLADRERTAVVLREIERAMCTLSAGGATEERIDPAAYVAAAMLEDLPDFFEGIACGEPWQDAAPPDSYARGALIWCLERPALRDVGLLTWVGGRDAGDEALTAQLRYQEGEEYSHRDAHRMWGEGPRPDPERLTAALAACRWAAASAPRASRPGPLAACAWLSWALGRTSHAEVYVRMAWEIEPGHGLTEIVATMVQAGHLPEWAFRP